MDVFEGHSELPRRLREPVLAIGNFDGVHVGHRELLSRARAAARARGGEAVCLTFEPHPAKVLAPTLAPPLITTRARKLELIAASGIDVCLVEPFTAELAALDETEFVDRVLVGALGARELVVGYDFTYGRGRQGTVDSLRAEGDARGLAVHVVKPVTVAGLVASSTKIREFLLEGNVDGARLLLGRDFDVDGAVVKGAGRGRSIGIPTANLAVEGELLPRPGVYAVRVALLGDDAEAEPSRPAVANLGTNPTFVIAGTLSLEVHLLDFEGDLYGRSLRVAFHARLRGEERFPSADALVGQIHRDIEQARRLLERIVP